MRIVRHRLYNFKRPIHVALMNRKPHIHLDRPMWGGAGLPVDSGGPAMRNSELSR